MIYEERQYQNDVIDNCIKYFIENNAHSVMIESPVGSGKTFMALKIISELERILEKTLRVNWIAPRRHLLEQIMQVNANFNKANIRPISLFEKNPPPADLVILDEAHHEATQSCIMLYDKIKPTYTLGLSATPMRTDRMKLSFQNTVTSCSIGRLIREDYLSQFNLYILPNYNAESIAQEYLATPEKWGKSIAFFKTIKECQRFKNILETKDIKCEVVTGSSNKEAQIDLFARDKVDVIANVAMLSEGFDLPELKTVFVRDASRLPTIQMCGRALRKSPDKSFCNIVQSDRTSFSFEKIATPKNSFKKINDNWLALTDKTDKIAEVIAHTLELIAEKKRSKDSESNSSRRSEIDVEREEFLKARRQEDVLKDYYLQHEDFYLMLYKAYSLINKACWQGALPQVVIRLNRSSRGVWALAFACCGDSDTTQGVIHSITFNLEQMKNFCDQFFWTVLLHEMVHIWQFSLGSSGGHGKDFYDEEHRCGLYERDNRVVPGSPFDNVLYELEALGENLNIRLKEIQEDTRRSSKLKDIEFFNDKYHVISSYQ